MDTTKLCCEGIADCNNDADAMEASTGTTFGETEVEESCCDRVDSKVVEDSSTHVEGREEVSDCDVMIGYSSDVVMVNGSSDEVHGRGNICDELEVGCDEPEGSDGCGEPENDDGAGSFVAVNGIELAGTGCSET